MNLKKKTMSIETLDETNSSDIEKGKVNEAFEILKELGIDIPSENEKEIREILSTKKILDIDKDKGLTTLLNLDEKKEEEVRKNENYITVGKKFLELYEDLLLKPLIDRTRQILQSENISLAQEGKIGFDDSLEVKILDLSDSELVEIGEEKLKGIMSSMLESKNMKASQGFYWNVLLSEESPYVLKTQRKKEKDHHNYYRKVALLRYPVIRECLGKEFLPSQVLFEIDNKRSAEGAILDPKEVEVLKETVLLQEKVPLEKMVDIKGDNVGKFVSGEYGKEVLEVIENNPQNREKLERFIHGFERLYKKHQYVVDLLGRNLFLGIGKDGQLDIKLVDYGVFKERKDNYGKDVERIASIFKIVDKLKEKFNIESE